MWLLFWIQLIQGDVPITLLGVYETHEECIYDMHEAEILIHNTFEAMVCLQDVDDWDGNA